MLRVITIANAKGGVGKTTTCVSLGSCLATLGKKTLLIDFDPQANATSGLGISPEDSIYRALLNEEFKPEFIKRTAIPNCDIIPASPNLSGALVELISFPDREYRLRKVVSRVRHLYDFILIDLPPSLTILTINGLVASDEVLIPIQCEYYSLEGIGQLLNTIDLVRENLGYNIKIIGALLTMYDKRERLSREVAKEVRRHFSHPVFNVEIPKAVVLAEAPSFGKPIILFAPDSLAAQSYLILAKEIINQEQKSLVVNHQSSIIDH